MKRYEPKIIEPKWQQVWADTKLYAALDNDPREKFYALMEFPYPSGDGLHTGHVLGYTAMDIIARHKRMQGFNVLYPIGFDEFGLPTENYAIKHKIAPQVATERNVNNFRKQFKALGLSFDWDREVRTSDPNYYRWTQWIFLQLLKKDLAYQAEMPINWCPFEKTGLANEEVVDGKHERCGTPVEKKLVKQWMLKITAYADRLAADLKTVNYLDRISSQQINWIGRSEGAEITFMVGDIAREPKDSLKFTPELTELVLEGKKTNTIRLEPKKLQENDYVTLITRLSTTETRAFARARISKVETKPLRDIPVDLEGHEPYASREEQLADYRKYYGVSVELDTEFTIYYFEDVQPGIKVYTTRPDTLFGATFLVVSPEVADSWLKVGWKAADKVKDYIKKSLNESELSRQETKDKTGVDTGVKAVHPLSGAEVPVWVADYVLGGYGTGAIMAVPAHDERDHEFAKAFNLPIQQVIAGDAELPFAALGKLINSGQFDGLEGPAAKHAIVKALFDKGAGKAATKYKLRDWIFSRQHYWGEPIPVIHCAKDGAVPVPEDQLPVTLPVVESYEPTDTGESPLAAITDWVNTTCPACGGPAKRETDTMPNWAGSSWYYLRYMDPHNDKAFASQENLAYWGPVDHYNGGMEHTTLHLLYSRFWHKFLYDQGLVPTPEPYAKRTSHGMILGPDNQKMSKSKGNVINPDAVVAKYGADTIRLYEMFMGPFDEQKIWSEDHLNGVSRFIYRVWTLAQDLINAPADTTTEAPATQGAFETEVDRITHKTLKKVHEDIQGMQYNTGVSALMELINFLTKSGTKARLLEPASAALRQRTLRTLILMLAPFTPHVTEELWRDLGEEGSVHAAGWPKYDPQLIQDDLVTIVVQVNGKVRANLIAAVDATDAELAELAKADETIQRYLADGHLVKTIVVPRKLVSFVVK